MDKQYYLRAYAEGQPGAEAGTPIRFTASTETVARDGLVVEQAGWRLDNFARNPVFLWVHDYGGTRLPIGRATPMVMEGRLVADVEFDQEDEFARQVESKYRRGFLHAISVGFNPLKIVPGNAGSAPRSVETELLDISAVPVPGDPLALKERQARALEELGQELAETLEGEAETGEAVWEHAAVEMMRLMHPATRMPEGQRRKAYNRVCVAYRKLGRTAPEFLGDADLDALTVEQVGGLLLEGETELLPGWFAASTSSATGSASEDLTLPFPEGKGKRGREVRSGAVLSTRNLSDLQEAVRLIQSVLQRAEKETANQEETEERSDEEPMQRIVELAMSIKHKLGGVE